MELPEDLKNVATKAWWDFLFNPASRQTVMTKVLRDLGTDASGAEVRSFDARRMTSAIRMVIEGGEDTNSDEVGTGGLVACSYRQGVVVETLDTHLAASRVGWWKTFIDNVIQKEIGRGTFNSVSVVDCAQVGIPPDFWTKTYPDIDKAPTKLAVRKAFPVKNDKGRQIGLTKQDVASEIFLQCYCACHGIGPRLFAAFYTDKYLEGGQNDKYGDLPNSNLPGSTFTTKSENALQRGPVNSMASVSECWSGSVGSLFEKWGTLSVALSVDEANFAKTLVGAINRAAKVGIFHGDIKPDNMLYRGEKTTLEVCLTDFDPTFCLLISPAARDHNVQRCMTAAMVAMFLGYLKCVNPVVHKQHVEHVKGALLAIYPNLWTPNMVATCNFLRETAMISDAPNRLKFDIRELPNSSLEAITQYRDVSEIFQHLVAHYAGNESEHNNKEVSPHCFKLEAGRSLYAQLLDYSFGRVPMSTAPPLPVSRPRP